MRERLRAALERVTTLEEQLAGAHQQVSACSPSMYLSWKPRLAQPLPIGFLWMLTAVSLSWLETAGRREAGDPEGSGAGRGSLVSDSLCWAVPYSCLPCSREQGSGTERRKRRGLWSWD